MPRIPHDYHMHSEFSIDCSVSITDRCERAVALDIPEICVTDHADFVSGDEGIGYYEPDAYFQEVEHCRSLYEGQVRLQAGVEIGEWHRYPEQAAALAGQYPYDFIIGSLHWVDPASTGSAQTQLVLVSEYFDGRSEAEAYGAYFDELLEMVRIGGFDVIGHLDVPKRAGFNVYGRFSSSDFEEPIREVLRVAIERGIGIEVNTGTARRPVGEPSPDIDVLRWYYEMGGEILTVGSDAHGPDHLAYDFDRVAAMLEEVGFTAITSFDLRQPYFVDLK